jgi:hypothetical protein
MKKGHFSRVWTFKPLMALAGWKRVHEKRKNRLGPFLKANPERRFCDDCVARFAHTPLFGSPRGASLDVPEKAGASLAEGKAYRRQCEVRFIRLSSRSPPCSARGLLSSLKMRFQPKSAPPAPC